MDLPICVEGVSRAEQGATPSFDEAGEGATEAGRVEVRSQRPAS